MNLKFVLVNVYLGSKNVDLPFKREAVVSLSRFLALPDLRSRAESLMLSTAKSSPAKIVMHHHIAIILMIFCFRSSSP